MALWLPSSSPAPGIDASKTDSEPCNRYEKQAGEVVGLTKPSYLVPPDEGADPKGGYHPLSPIRDYVFRLGRLVAGMVTRSPAERRFILDSAASIHTTGNVELLEDFIQGSSAGFLQVCEGRRLRIEGVGSLACHGFCIPNVHYVAGLTPGYTLVSVQQLANSGHNVLFRRGCCDIENIKDGSLVGKGRLHDGSYHLEYLKIPLDAHQGSS